MPGWLQKPVPPPQEWEADMLRENLPGHLMRGMADKIRGCHDLTEAVNLINAYQLPEDFLDGTEAESQFREIRAGLLEEQEQMRRWEAVNGPSHPQRWQRYTSPKYTRLR